MAGEHKRKILRGAWSKLDIFWKFTVLSFAAFAVVGILIASVVPPALEAFIVSRQKADAVVQVNRLTSQLLEPQDFVVPLKPESRTRFEEFFRTFHVPAFIGAAFFDMRGNIVYGTPRIHIPADRFKHIGSVVRTNIPEADFTVLDAEGQEHVGTREVFSEYIPITFGASKQIVGVLHILSRTGFIQGAIRETRTRLITRLLAGLVFLYALLSTIVWRASRLIRMQTKELKDYAMGLEEKVRERTRDLEETTKRELAKAAEVTKLKDEFVFIAAHELRLPAFVIKGNAELLRDDTSIASLSPDAQGSLKEIERAGDRLQNLVNDLLSTARLEYGTVKFKLEPTDIWEVLKKGIKEIELFAKEHGVAVRAEEWNFTRLPKVLADSQRLSEVFMNLLTNAVKYNKPNGTVTIRGELADHEALIHVADTGIGLTPEEQTHLFTKFWRASSKSEGTGLGLWITRHLVEKMEGAISVVSEKGKGSTFTVKLRVA